MVSAVSVTWNGTTITGPMLIYSDELPVNDTATTIGDPNRPGALICRSEDRVRVNWHYTRGNIVRSVIYSDTLSDTYKQIRTGEGATPSLSQLLLNKENTEVINEDLNGIWHCRLNAAAENNNQFEEQISVGIYSRGGGILAV